jgi:hypothetical protein
MLRFLADLPVRIIAWISDLLEIMLRFFGGLLDRGNFEDSDRPVGFYRSLNRKLAKFFWFLAQLISYPIAGFFFRGERRRAFLCSIPFWLLGSSVMASCLLVAFNRERILNRYLARVQNAYSKQDGPKGVRAAMRWIGDTEFANADRKFLYSLVEIQNGNAGSAERILEGLSPRDSTGLGIAHYWKASQCVGKLEESTLGESQRRELLDELDWHLERASGVRPEQIALLESMKAFWDGRLDEAESKYRQVFESDVFQSLGFASLLKRLGKDQERQTVLKTGAQRMADRLRSDPWNRAYRVELASLYESLGEWGKAEQVNLEGYKIHRDQDSIDAYLASMERRTEAALKEPRDLREVAYCLVKFLRTTGASPRVQDIMARSLLRPQSELLEIQKQLQRWLVEGLDLPMVHLSLSFCKGLSGDDSSRDWHLEQACRYEQDTIALVQPLIGAMQEASKNQQELHERMERWRVVEGAIEPKER